MLSEILSGIIAVQISMLLSPSMSRHVGDTDSVYLHKSYDYFAFMILSSNMFDCSTTNKDLKNKRII